MGKLLRLLTLLILVCAGCTPAPMIGPEMDPQQSAAPDPHATPAVPLPQPTSVVPPSAGGMIPAWVPPQVQPDGTRTAGHWVQVSLTPPAKEVLNPPLPIPRAPLVPLPHAPVKEKAVEPARGVTPPPAQALPPATLGLPAYPGLPQLGGQP